MSLNPECCDEKTSIRDGGALARQRRLICGLFIWSTLLTLVLATCIFFQFFYGASQVSGKPAKLSMSASPTSSPVMAHGSTTQSSDLTHNLITFDPDLGRGTKIGSLKWKTILDKGFISVLGETLTVTEDGLYFLYLQVTLKPNQSCTVTVQVNGGTPILSSQINVSKPSTGLMGKGFPMTAQQSLTVTCKPAAEISNNSTETYLGVIKIV